jgi:hypothetical protein
LSLPGIDDDDDDDDDDDSEADHLPASSAEVKECVELYPHSPIHLHGVVLS